MKYKIFSLIILILACSISFAKLPNITPNFSKTSFKKQSVRNSLLLKKINTIYQYHRKLKTIYTKLIKLKSLYKPPYPKLLIKAFKLYNAQAKKINNIIRSGNVSSVSVNIGRIQSTIDRLSAMPGKKNIKKLKLDLNTINIDKLDSLLSEIAILLSSGEKKAGTALLARANSLISQSKSALAKQNLTKTIRLLKAARNQTLKALNKFAKANQRTYKSQINRIKERIRRLKKLKFKN